MDGIFGGFEDLVVPRLEEHLGQTDLSFGGKLLPALKICEDGGESGCGGKVWIAGELLCEYVLEKSNDHLLSKTIHGKRPFKKVLELGSGTGLVGLCVGLLEKNKFHDNTKVYVTDIDKLVPLMERNIQLDKVQYEVLARELWWGEPLSADFSPQEGDLQTNNVDLVLAADCVYLEKAFPLLERTLLDLTNCISPPVILMAYKKRRKADKQFFNKIKKNFDVLEITDFIKFNYYLKQKTHLFQLVRKCSPRSGA
ncbi:Protein-lysine N-methyltransferase efm6 [Saccharomyces pastorianus]|uniref:Protein-lysine N-methyltransferase EFM6 n=1 Tax=Saccharomyces pastorianus TaxID=27292 RepID=A0A6C1EG29_SACPS|nr:hypothetical protein DI49_4713 [Saccharomyces eubayanus]KOG97134.1 hypothetical protein DI49_4713 [Saccharomyces eubayanus]QID87750.1 Protein-lysine N-methyltransferase efm6 [Saccharomyces pastorianus]